MLSIEVYRKEIVNSVLNNRVTIVTAETGSGKSTQIPQYLVQYFRQVIVTEPRRMAAKTLAIRVSNEMGTPLGETVGYKTAYDKCATNDSKIIYCTDGLQLVRSLLGSDDTSNMLLIIDEIHEWNNNQEQLIAWTKLTKIKTIIMSATMDVNSLKNYYKDEANTIHVSGNQYKVEIEERNSSLEFIDCIKENISSGKNILAFLPGKKEIFETIEKLKGENAVLLPLHGEMDWEDQSKCFKQYNKPKVICATNVAQTSLTIPDIDVVIDLGKARVSDVNNGIQGLFLKNISQADIMQRAGRAGRTKDGKYVLCSEEPINSRPKFQKPEVERSLLDRLVLQFANIGLDAEKIEFFHQPSKEAISLAKTELINLGAMNQVGTVTEIGKEMVRIPLNAQLARMIVEAEKLGVTEDVITIASIVEIGGLLSKNKYYSSFTRERKSDLLAELDVWNYCNSLKKIDFEKEGINKKNFFKIKEHIKAVKEAVNGIITLTTSNNRDDILMACLSGFVTHIFVNNWGDTLIDKNGVCRKLDRKSCIQIYGKCVFGIPKTIEFRNSYGYLSKMELVSFATEIDEDTALKIVPQSYISSKTFEAYSAEEDVVVQRTIKYILNIPVKVIDVKEYNHPQYEELKQEYMSEFGDYYNFNRNSKKNQIRIQGKEYLVFFDGKEPYILINEKDLFTIEEEKITLNDGTIVTVKCKGKSSKSITTLKNMVYEYVSVIIRKRKREKYNKNVVNSILDFDLIKGKLGKIKLKGEDLDYGNVTVEAFCCLKIQKDGRVILDIVEDETTAKKHTEEAIQYLAMRKLKKEYVDSKFSHQTGKKRKELSEEEKKIKEDFWHLAIDVVASMDSTNVEETLQFIEEYYVELMN